MPSKLQIIKDAYNHQLDHVTQSPAEWTAFLRAAARNYKLPFDEQLLVYAQRPDATAVLELERWNELFYRRVNAGSTGIAVFDRSAVRPRLKYYFDIADTHETLFSLPVPLWEITPDVLPDVMETLRNSYGQSDEETEVDGLEDALMIAAVALVEDNLPDYAEQLAGLDESFDQSLYRQAVLCGVAHIMLSRCGIDPDALDMSWISQFNTTALVNLLGVATSDIAEMGLREIAAVVIPLQKNSFRTFDEVPGTVYNEIIPAERKGQEHDQHDLHASGRLPGAQPDPAATARGRAEPLGPGTVELPAGAQEGAAHAHDDTAYPVAAPVGDAGNGSGTVRPADRADGRGPGRGRSAQSPRSNAVGRQDGQHPAASGGTGEAGADLQLSLFLTVEEQTAKIEEAGAARAAAFSVPKGTLLGVPFEELDRELLRDGDALYGPKFAMYKHFTDDHTPEENAQFLKEQFGIGGHSPQGEGGFWVDTDSKGLRFRKGNLLHPDEDHRVPWPKAAQRVRDLIVLDRFLTPFEQEHYPDYLEYLNDLAVRREKQAYIDFVAHLPPEEKRDSLAMRLADFIDSLDRHEKDFLGDHGLPELAQSVATQQIDILMQNPQRTQQLMDALAAIQGRTSNVFARSNAWRFGLELIELHPRHYVYQAGDTVHINGLREIAYADERVVRLKNPKFPLLSEEMPRDVFERQLRESPHNNRFLVLTDAPEPAPNPETPRILYKKYLSLLLEEIQKSELYPYLRDRDTEEWDAETEIGEKLDSLADSFRENDPAFFEAYGQLPQFRDWLAEDLFQRTYQDFSLETRDSVAQNEAADDCPEWARRPPLPEQVREELNLGGFVVSEKLIASGLEDYHAEGGREDAEGVAKYIIDTYLTEDEPEPVAEKLFEETSPSGERTDYYLFHSPDSADTSVALSLDTLPLLTEKADSYVICANVCFLSEEEMARWKIVFRKLPRDWTLLPGEVQEQIRAVKTEYEHLSEDESELDDELLERTEHDAFNEYSRMFIQRVLRDEPYLNACKNSDEQNARIECDAAIDRIMQSIGTDNLELYKLFHDTPGFQQRVRDYVFDWTYTQPKREIERLLRPTAKRATTEQRNFRFLNELAPEILSGEATYLHLTAGEGMMPLSIDLLSANGLSVAHYYEQSGDLMADPDMTFVFDREAGTLAARSFQQDGLGVYQQVENANGGINRALERQLNSFAAQWFRNIRNQGYRRDVMNVRYEDDELELVYAEDGSIQNINGEVTLAERYARAHGIQQPIEMRYQVTMTSDAFPDPEDAYAIWDAQTDDYYADEDGTLVTFPEEAEAVAYREKLIAQEEPKRPFEPQPGFEAWSEPAAADNTPEHPGEPSDDVAAYLPGAAPVPETEHRPPQSLLAVEAELDHKVELMREHPDYEKIKEAAGYWKTWRNMSHRVGVAADALVNQINALDDQQAVAWFSNVLWDNWREALDIGDFEPLSVKIRREEIPQDQRNNFRITDDALGHGGAKAKFRMNVEAITLLKTLDTESRLATPAEQETLSRYVGWGGIPQAFDPDNAQWAGEYQELKPLLTDEEYTAARASTLNAHYTSPTVIKAVYKAIENMGFTQGNVLEPSCGIGNFFGLVPESMNASKMYGVELDPITGRIARQLYQNVNIAIEGFEATELPDSFFDLAIGNVPFGDYAVPDRRYDKHKFHIHDYFFAKTLDKVRPGGVVAFITSKYTMDKQNPAVRKYIAQRAELLGAIRLPNTAFKANAGTEVTADIIFLQKRDRAIEIEPEWVHLGYTDDDIAVNSYFAEHPEMMLGEMVMESTAYGHDTTCHPFPGRDLADLLGEAVQNIHAEITDYERDDRQETEGAIPADPSVHNFSYTIQNGSVYYRENSIMVPQELSVTAHSRVKGMIEIRDSARRLIELQTEDAPVVEIQREQTRLGRLYDAYTAKYGLLSDRANASVFRDDGSYPLLCSLEVLDKDGKLERKADMFTKRTIRPYTPITHVDTAAEALTVSMAEKARVDMDFMEQLSGLGRERLIADLEGVIFHVPNSEPIRYATADEYLSGNVRQKLNEARAAAAVLPELEVNARALEAAQPKDLTASEISVRLGATWVPTDVVQDFIFELLEPSYWAKREIQVHYSQYTAEWNITGKSMDKNSIAARVTYGTDRISAYHIIEQTLNLRTVKVFDTVIDEDGKEKRVLNPQETAIAQGKQEVIKAKFLDWVWDDPDRRDRLCGIYNSLYNSTRPREYDGSHIQFVGMNPEKQLDAHQRNGVARHLYGGNTLLGHVVGSGKTYTMIAAAMESKRLGLSHKALFVVPNNIVGQFAAEFLQLYPSANVLMVTARDFEKQNRRKFCARIATGDYDGIVMAHSQFEKLAMSVEWQQDFLQQQVDDLADGIAEMKEQRGERVTVKSMERTRKSLQTKIQKLNEQDRKDDMLTFEELGVDLLFVDEADLFKNLMLVTKMRNVAGIGQSDAQKASDLFMKTRYLDAQTGNRGVVFATGTPISNTMAEMYTMQRYLQYDTLVARGLEHFDCWLRT